MSDKMRSSVSVLTLVILVMVAVGHSMAMTAEQYEQTRTHMDNYLIRTLHLPGVVRLGEWGAHNSVPYM
jgi:hypothetical protein